MSDSSLVTIVGEKIVLQEERGYKQRYPKWSTFVDGKDGFLYGIPCRARRVVKFNPVDKSMELIGPDLGPKTSWNCGVLAKNGCIYCPPDEIYSYDDGWKMLKINTHDGTVVTFDTEKATWHSGVLGADNCIYFTPFAIGSDGKDI